MKEYGNWRNLKMAGTTDSKYSVLIGTIFPGSVGVNGLLPSLCAWQAGAKTVLAKLCEEPLSLSHLESWHWLL
jgi:hypothetical protein